MKKILFLIIILAFSSCATTKTALKEDVKLDVIEAVDRTEKTSETASKTDSITTDAKTTMKDNSVTKITETEYSEPDASGQQHITKTIETETRNDIVVDNEEKARVISEQKNVIDKLTADNSELKTKLKSALDEKSKTSTRVPTWIFLVLFLGGGLLALFIRKWIEKRFKL